MSIQELSLKFKGFFINSENVLAMLIIAVAFVSFYLGRASARQIDVTSVHTAAVTESNSLSKPFSINSTSTTYEEGSPIIPEQGKGYVASKSGTKYHLPWCGGAKQIKEENKVWFATKEEAEKAGYTPASNCKGI